MSKKLPADITSYDLIKAAAVIIMIIDHIGYYFYPDMEWFRAVGRIGFPVWFFMIGYARGRSLSRDLLLGAALLIVSSSIFGMGILPMNALVTIILIRLLIDQVMAAAVKNDESLVYVMFMLLILVFPTGLLVEYGTQGLITAMFGYAVRNHVGVPGLIKARGLKIIMMLLTVVSFILFQQLAFMFSPPALVFMAIGSAITCLILLDFHLVTYARLTASLPKWAVLGTQFLGRKTLEIYVFHLILFKILGMILHPDRFGLFDWKILIY